MTSPLVGFSAMNAVVFGVYGQAIKVTSNDHAHHHYRSMAFAGAIAGLCQTPVASVVELVKTRLQVQGKGERRSARQSALTFAGPIDCLRKIYQKEGIRRGVFRGLVATVLRDTYSFASYFPTYEFVCRLAPTGESSHWILSGVVTLVGGGLAGCVAWLVSYPFDVVKSRLQADGVDKVRYSGLLDCFRKSYQAEGISVFGKGLGSALVRAFPVNAATFTAVEMYRYLLN